MTKYNQSLKQQVIDFYLQNGFNGLAVSYTKQIYSPEFKLSVVQAVKNGVFSTRKAALYFGIPEPALISQ